MNDPAPIALFTYNRLDHTRKTIEALRGNDLASQSDLFIFSDGPLNSSDGDRVEDVRLYAKTISGFKTIALRESNINKGLARSIIEGVTDIVGRFGRVIVLEDDLVASPYFLKYMNDALAVYEHDRNVASIHGYLYPIRTRLPETFFLRGTDCWGWATWKRAWDTFEKDGKKSLSDLRSRRLEYSFDLSGCYPYTKMLEDAIAGKNQSWAILWHASAFVKEMYTLYPRISLVRNIGIDRSGTHLGESNRFNVDLANKTINVSRIAIEENREAVREVAQFLHSVQPNVVQRLASNLKKMILMKSR